MYTINNYSFLLTFFPVGTWHQIKTEFVEYKCNHPFVECGKSFKNGVIMLKY